MAKVFYSMAGEGRGHATRVRSIVEALRDEHELSLFASGAAHELLETAYADTPAVNVHRIPGLFFHYDKRRLSYAKTFRAASGYVVRLPALIATLERQIRLERPDLVITDFEPALARAARRCGVPFVSLDHQHFLVASDLSSLPWRLRYKAWAMARGVSCYYGGQAATVVSSFYFPPLRKGCENVVQIGVLMRPAILQAEVEHRRHLLVYLRRFADDHVLEALKRCGREVRIYGLGEWPRDGNLSFHAVCENGFLEDLATCDALVSNAGNQLVGEALFLRKPVLAMPEAKNFEQYVNAHFLRQDGGGDWTEPDAFDETVLRGFLNRLDEFRDRIDPERLNGNERALEVIREHLPPISAPPLLAPESPERITA